MSILTDTKKQIEDVRRLTHDLNRWMWVLDINKAQIAERLPQTLLIILDNDVTLLEIKTVKNDDERDDDEQVNDDESISFDSSIGNCRGICELLEALRIPCEVC